SIKVSMRSIASEITSIIAVPKLVVYQGRGGMSLLGSAAVFTRLCIRPSAERQQQITVFKQKYATMEKTSTDTHTRLVLRKLYGLSVAKVDSIVTEMLNPPTADS